MHLSSSWKDLNQSIITSSHLVCSVFQGPVSGVAQQSERTSSGLRSAGDPGHLQTRTQRDQDMSGCTDNEENSEQNFGTNYSIGFFFRGLSHKFFKPWWPRSSASREGDLRRLPPNRPRLFGSFFFFFLLRCLPFFFFFFCRATLQILPAAPRRSPLRLLRFTLELPEKCKLWRALDKRPF